MAGQLTAVLQFLCGVSGVDGGGFFLMKKSLSDCASYDAHWRTANVDNDQGNAQAFVDGIDVTQVRRKGNHHV
ncbi:MAG: hypothetical protein WBC92_04530 [Terracidiphilus sp.]